MQTFMECEQKKLLKKFHTLLERCGIGQEGKEAILHSYGVESSRELSARELFDICDKLAMRSNEKLEELNTWRKRVIAAISAYHRAMGVGIFLKDYKDCSYAEKGQRVRYASGTAEKAAGKEFNKIPLEQLRSLYNGFRRNGRSVETVNKMAENDLLHSVSLN